MAGGPVVTKGAARKEETQGKNGERAGGSVVVKAGNKMQESGTPGKKAKRPSKKMSSSEQEINGGCIVNLKEKI